MTALTSPPPFSLHRAIAQSVPVALAVLVPALLAFNMLPSVTFLNQAAACVGWAAVVAWGAGSSPGALQWHRVFSNPGMRALLVALMVMAVAAMAAPFWAGLPAGLALSAAGLLLGAALVATLASASPPSETVGLGAFGGFCWALVLAGAASLVLAFVQKFAPQWADGNWIAFASSPGRVGGNLRQPNHLSSLLLLSCAALIWLHDSQERASEFKAAAWRVLTSSLMVALMLGLVLTVSRTGAVCVLLMALWGVLDRRLSRFSRVLLWTLPIVYGACWFGVSAWAQATVPDAFVGSDQLHKADLSSSRFGIWSNTLSLVRLHPWLGIGWGEFNFAWSLTPFPGRPVAFFDHTHNLPLQLLVELGIPLALLVMGLLIWCLRCAWVNCRTAPVADQPAVRCALVMVLMMGIHSMLEYPLWYAYFLLPTAFAFGFALMQKPSSAKSSDAGPAAHRAAAGKGSMTRTMVSAGIVLMGASVFSVIDYLSVSHIFAPPKHAKPLQERIAKGQRSWFFAHHADYAAVTTAEHPSEAMEGFGRATHFLLDTRLMMAWARAYNELGDVQRARYLAQRLKEFRNPQSDDFFAECNAAAQPGVPLPFQCTPPTKTFTYEDFIMR